MNIAALIEKYIGNIEKTFKSDNPSKEETDKKKAQGKKDKRHFGRYLANVKYTISK